MTALARRAVACAGWAWRPGMLTDTGIRVVAVGADDHGPYIDGWLIGSNRVLRYYTDPPLFGPDLDDPATMGCLLALVREAWGLPTASPSGDVNGQWEIWLRGLIIRCEPTEAAALVAALEAAPGRVG